MSEIDDLFEATPTQAGMIVDSLRVPGAYVAQVVCDVDGDLPPEVVRRAWADAVRRFPLLRTSFLWEDVERPLQVIWSDSSVPFRFVELSDPERAEADWEAIADVERSARFELESPTLSRVVLAALPGGRARLLWTHHHAIADGWSVAMVLADVLGACDGEHRPDPEPGAAYELRGLGARFVESAAATQFWQEMGRRRPATPTPVGFGPVEAAPGVRRGVRRRTRAGLGRVLQVGTIEFAATPAALALAAIAGVRSRATGDTTVTLGVTMSGRDGLEPGLADGAGCAITTVPLCIGGDDHTSNRTLVGDVQGLLRGAARHQHTPPAGIAAAFGVAQLSELLDWTVVFENYPLPSLDGRNFSVVAASSLSTTAFPLCIAVRILGDDLELTLEYDAGAIAGPDLEDLGDAFLDAIAEMVAAPDRTARWSGGVGDDDSPPKVEAPALVPLLVCDRFDRACESDAERIVVVDVDGVHRLVSLRRARDQAVHLLESMGVGSGDHVAVVLDRGAPFISWMLAVMAIGAVAVPMDPDRPAEQRAVALRSVEPVAIVVADDLHDPDATPPRIGRSTASATPPGPVAPVRTAPPRPDDVAYVLFTSGTTGVPKGVAVSHAALAAYLTWATERYGDPAPYDAPWHTAVGADLGITSWLVPILAGGCVSVVEAGAGGARLAGHLLSATRPQLVKLTPTHLMIALHLVGDATIDASGWRLVVGGEALDPEVIRATAKALPGAVVFNEYGPTEATVGCCVARVEPTIDADGVVPIGVAAAGCELHVADRLLRSTPGGTVGYLYIGGPQVARGYVGRPRETAAAFRPDPWSSTGGRLYFTGDRVLRRQDGVLEYVGRTDRQVNLGGARLELGELESIGRAHPAVVDCAAMQLPDPSLPAILVVAHVESGHDDVSGTDIERHLRDGLGRFVALRVVVTADPLPVANTGKIDPRVLASFADRLPSRADGVTRLVDTEVGGRVAAAIASIVGARPSDDSNFFLLGGDSLAAAKVCGRLTRETGTAVELQWLFDADSIGGFVEMVTDALDAAARVSP